jgi:histidine ammonia-lyase
MPVHHISPAPLSLAQVREILLQGHELRLSPEAERRIQRCHDYLQAKMRGNDTPFYGINTGFGSLCDVAIPPQDLEALQHNLVVSHACGTGDLVPPDIVRIMLLLKIQSLAHGHSGVRVALVQRLIDLFNADLLPVVYELGSLGASGDLAPLAHLSLPLIGLGEIWHDGRRQRADVLLKAKGMAPLRFQAKEALALLNGTQFSAAYAVWSLLEGERLADIADFNAALGYDAFNCQLSPLDANIHRVRPHAGQVAVAERLRNLLKDSAIAALPKATLQDPYAFRCVPQVHGASRDALSHVGHVLATELNAVTDNPNIFPDEDLILSGGNFHAQPLALPLDYLGIALAELGSIAERRMYQLMSGDRGLPAFLTPEPGLHSGMMIVQYSAAAVVSQNKNLCSPASVDSIVSCNGKEDHVSMAANAATKTRRIVLNLERLLAMELMVAAQALDYRRPHRSAPPVEALHEKYRKMVPTLAEDRLLHYDIALSIRFLRENWPSLSAPEPLPAMSLPPEQQAGYAAQTDFLR